MASYISSNENRFYTTLEPSYGKVGVVSALNRIPALKLTVQQQLDVKDRKDKTGSRTFSGMPAGGRRRTTPRGRCHHHAPARRPGVPRRTGAPAGRWIAHWRVLKSTRFWIGACARI